MKIKLSTNLLVNTIIILYICLVAFYFAALQIRPGRTSISDSTSTFSSTILSQNLKLIDKQLPDSLPYRRYIQLSDSIKTVRALKNSEHGGGTQFGQLIGTQSNYLFCDTCTLKGYWHHVMDNSGLLTQYYVTLPGWKLKATRTYLYSTDSVIYYAEQNRAYIRKQIIDRSSISKNGMLVKHTKEVDEPVKFRYNQRCLMIPVSESTKNILDKALMVLGILLGAYLLYVCAAFLKLLIDLSKGLSFTADNISRLKLIATSFLVYPVAIFLLNLMMKLIFHNYFTPDVIINEDIWINSWKIISIGVIFLLLFRAFRQGKLLKEEQDLTV